MLSAKHGPMALDAGHWLIRAGQAREVAEWIRDPVVRRLLLEIAERYEQIAKRPGAYHFVRGIQAPEVPQREKRPADVSGAAVKAMRIAKGEKEKKLPGRSAAAQLGRRGGEARAKKLSAKRRREIARSAATKRWESS